MGKALVILIVLFGVFLATGCAEEGEEPTEAGTPAEDVTITATDTPVSPAQKDSLEKSLFQSIEYNSSSWRNQRYTVIELFGTNYVPLNPEKNKLAKLVLDSGDRFTLRTGETLDLGDGYSLEAKQIDVEGKKILLEFTMNGEYIDDELISVVDTTDEASTWEVELDDVQDEDGVVVLRVHINQIYEDEVDTALIDGIWLIDFQNAFTIKPGEEFNGYEIAEINDEYISYE